MIVLDCHSGCVGVYREPIGYGISEGESDVKGLAATLVHSLIGDWHVHVLGRVGGVKGHSGSNRIIVNAS